MKQSEIQRVWPEKVNRAVAVKIQLFLLCLCFANGCLSSIVYTDKSMAAYIWQGEIFAVLGMAFSFLAEKLEEKNPVAKGVIIVPWLGLAVIVNPLLWWQGFLGWLNVLIDGWNQLHEGGIPLFLVESSADAGRGFFMAVSLALGIFLWKMVGKRRMIAGLVCVISFLSLMLLEECFQPLAGLLLMTALMGMAISDLQFHFAVRNLMWILIATLIMVGAAIPQRNVQSALDIKTAVKTGIHDLRYGKEVLPEGDLTRAGMLHQSEKKMLTLWSEQKKQMYLKGFVGAKYQDGKWRKMPDSAYADTYQGMLSWLEEKQFSPITQVSRYYQLSDKEEQPQLNRIQINVASAARDYVYVTMGLSDMSMGNFKEVKDFSMTPRGVMGESLYVYEEISKDRPAELLVPDSWVSNPKTEEQKEYCEAEAVYRDFVYDTYTEVDSELLPTIQNLFWADYDSESDGIYSAVSRVREVLKKNQVEETRKENTDSRDPLVLFLENREQKNAVYYATAGVLALRAHGIPARYVEGYFVSENRLLEAENGGTEVSGQDAHAWMEVYFDGIGWLPVDVTPGYYYDAATLQNMVRRPEDIKKTAALESDDTEADETNKPGKPDDLGRINSGEKRPLWQNVVLGVVSLLLLMFSCCILMLELKRAVALHKKQKELCSDCEEERVVAMKNQIFGVLNFWGIVTGLGWNTLQTDELISDTFSKVKPGDYRRVCEILEKQIYGGETLAVYEERTIRVFLGHLVESAKDKKIPERIRFHYAQGRF